MLSLLILLTLLPVCRPQQGSTQFVRICGQYPNRYLSYGPCPDENGQPQQQQICSRAGWSPTGISCRLDTDCTGGQRLQQTQRATNLDVSLSQCDQGQCCAPPMSPNGQPPGGDGTDGYLWWDTCENGGYFTGQNCQTSRDCVATGQWAHYSQICLQGECCTTGGASQPGNGGDGNQNLDDICLRNGGRRLRNSGCIRHADCNILVGRLQELPRIEASQQILCQNSQCCLMRRTLPIGFTSWAQACPQSGGRFLGMFCKMDQQDCRTTADSLSLIPQRATCELRRYCCASSDPSNDRWRRQNLGCDQGDRPTGSRCRASGDCYQGEYCGDQSICCLLRGNDARPDPGRDDDTGYPGDGRLSVPAFCYNGQQSMVNCSRPEDCKLLTQACVNGLCCTRTGDEWKNACAGAMAVSSCFLDRSCLDRLVCTSSDFCCECAFGQAAGKCTHGCPPNYACAPNGEFCCPRCAGGEQPHGSCYNGQCGTGYTCSAGNICCRS